MSENGNGHGGMTQAERRQAILSMVGHRETRETTMPGPDGPIPILVRELTAEEATAYERLAAKATKVPGIPIGGILLQMSIADPESGELLFEVADREALDKLGIAGLSPALKLAQELNGVSDADVAKARESLAPAPPIG